MAAVFLGIALLATAALVWPGIYFTLRGFRALDRPKPEVKPRQDAATAAHLKQFFVGKQCATCGRPIPPVHAGELRPGLLNASAQEAIAWDDVLAANLAATLETHVAICSNCLIIGTLRQKHPDRVVDRHRTIESPSH
ncbi:MAG TPA: hypothetical protein VL225_15530 [Vicinamibacterales bacterium]|nr:hypothetical protein [Vicinamibacterales bacterium]